MYWILHDILFLFLCSSTLPTWQRRSVGIVTVAPNPLVLRVIAVKLEADLEHTYGHTWLQTVNVVEC